MRRPLFGVGIVLVAGFLPPCGRGAEPEVVDYCRLASDPAQYDGKTIRTQAIAVGGREGTALYSESCNRRDKIAWYEDDPTLTARGEVDVVTGARKIMRRDGRVRVTIVGRFEGPKELEVSKAAPPWAAKLLSGRYERYGHMDCCLTQIVVTSIGASKRVKKKVPLINWEIDVGRGQ